MSAGGIRGPQSKPISQSQTTAAEAKPEVAKSAAAEKPQASGGLKSGISDTVVAAKSNPFEGIKASAQGIMAGGCCIPPPPKQPSFPDANKPAGPLGRALLEGGAKAAGEAYDKTVDKALDDGKITSKERRDIDGAGRNQNIAETKVSLDDARKAYQDAMKTGLADKRLTPDEAKAINDAQAKVQDLNDKLKGLQTEDKRLDRRDAILDAFDKPGPGIKGPGGLPDKPIDLKPIDLKPSEPKPDFPDFKLPDFKFPDFKFPELPFPFPGLPGFGKPPSLDIKPWLLQLPKLFGL